MTQVVAIGIGAALFFVLGRFAAIPTPIPNTSINIQYAILAVFAVLYGPLVGALAGFIGDLLIDVTGYGIWISWELASGVFGLIVGVLVLKHALADGEFSKALAVRVNLAIILANAVAWLFIAPLGDVLIYSEPANKVWAQGALAFVANSVTACILAHDHPVGLRPHPHQDRVAEPRPVTAPRTPDEQEDPPLLELSGYSFQYRAQAEPTLHDIDLTVRRGEKIAIVGASGSGKSTLLNAMNGLIPHHHRGTASGTVRVAGKDPAHVPLVEIASVVGTVLQDSNSQFVSLTVAEDIAFSLENQQVPQAEMPGADRPCRRARRDRGPARGLSAGSLRRAEATGRDRRCAGG